MLVRILLAAALIAAGALQVLSLSPFNIWPAALGSIILLLLVSGALTPKRQLTGKQAFLYGWAIGFGLFSSGASWVYVSINTYGNAPPALAGMLTLIFVAGLGLFHGLVIWGYSLLRTQSLILNAILFSALWVFGDGFRTFFLTGFPWLFIGDGQLEGPLRGWIPIIGSYGATFIIVLTSAAITALIHARNKATGLFCVAVCVALWLPTTLLNDKHWTSASGASLTTALIQLDIPQEDKWKRSQRNKTISLLHELTEDQLDKDLIFWPETAIPIFYNQAKPILNGFSDLAKQSNTTIVTGIPYRGWDDSNKQTVLHNSIVSLGAGDGIYHKQKLVPFGEYVPLQDLLRGLIAFFDLPMSNFRKGPEDQGYLNTNDFKASPFICYEVVYPDLVAKRARNADYLVTISNDSWFGKSIGPLQHLQIAQIRALENGRYMVRATNNGVTAIINNLGQIETRIPQFKRAVLEGKVAIFSGETPFTKFGSTPLFGA